MEYSDGRRDACYIGYNTLTGDRMLSYREGEVMVGIRLVAEGEVPPLDSDGLEAVAHHGFAQDATVVDLVAREASGIIVVRCLAEEVVGATHIHFALGLHVEEREVECRSACVARFVSDITTMEELGLGAVGIEIFLHALVFEVASPANEEIDGHLRAVGIENLEAITLFLEVVAYQLEAVGSLACQIGHGALIARDALAYEVVGGVVADLLDDVGADVGEEDEVRL